MEFLRNPGQTGAITPSSPYLVDLMMSYLDLDHARVVLEYGPGTGAITTALVARVRRPARFVAIEKNPAMAKLLRSRLPDVTLVEDSVENARQICDRLGIDEVDCIVSGLPWASFPGDLQTRIMDAMMTILRPGGTFVTFAYLHGLPLPSSRRFRRSLAKYFSSVEVSAPVWINLPPSIVIHCKR